MKIEKDKYVSIHYTLTDTDGNELDSSIGGEPLEYIQGNDFLIPGLERELEGKEPGAKFKCTIEPKDAYGERDERLVAKVPRDKFDSTEEIQVGMGFQVETPGGLMIVTVIKVEDDMITIDGNPEMAGKTLNFDVEVVEVRDMTEDEKAQLEFRAMGCGGGCGGCGGGCGNEDCEGCGGTGDCPEGKCKDK